MMKLTRRALLSASAFLVTPSLVRNASAQPQSKKLAGVVELFTSQGCNSCPPADAILANLAKRDDVLALAYHIDYWDYLGWKDTLASPENTKRQYTYSKEFGPRSTYTPQAIINGRTHMNGQLDSKIDAQLAADAANNKGLTVPVTLYSKANRFHIHIEKQPMTMEKGAKLILVYYTDATNVDIERDENSGKKITYYNTVNRSQLLGMWDGQSLDIELPMDEISTHNASNCAVLLQAISASDGPGAILGAAILPRTNA